MMNRQHRRVAMKAVRCLKRGTKVPGGVRAKLNPQALEVMAANLGKTIGRNGKVHTSELVRWAREVRV